MLWNEEEPVRRFMSLHIVEGETGLLMPVMYELHDRFLAKRIKALDFARACLYSIMSFRSLEDL